MKRVFDHCANCDAFFLPIGHPIRLHLTIFLAAMLAPMAEAALLRGPYLGSGSSTGMVVRWRTDDSSDSIVRLSLDNETLLATFTNPTNTTEHELRLTGLQPDTKYFYEIGSSTETLAANGICFRTAPTNTRPVTIWTIGDFGTADFYQQSVRDSYLNAVGPEQTDFIMMLGDNAYGAGFDNQYQAAVFDMYQDILPHVPVWPTIGNHDSYSADATGRFPYLDIFTLPENGEAGGAPSGTEKYYSFDHANIHFVCLDSQSSSRDSGGPMLNWLREDLAATEKDWIVAFWHHPPYSFGTHNSDGEWDMIEMRENALPILEQFGADLVLTGHSHVYERSFLLNGHYGYSTDLSSEMILDGTYGRDGEDGPYRKPAGGISGDSGTIYAVCGNSGQGFGEGDFEGHPAMAISKLGFGSMILRFNNLRLDAEFLRPDGSIEDYFTIDKSAPTTRRPSLEIVRSGNGAALTWPTSLPSYVLESKPILGSTVPWQMVTNPPWRAGRRNVVKVGFEQTNQFFRLRATP
jgi:acid phosphatase type 7